MAEPSGETLPQRQPELPSESKQPEVKHDNTSIGPQEQKIIDKAVQGGEPRDILEEIATDPGTDFRARGSVPNSIPDDAILDMVQGPDGKWSARDPADPNFLYKPKPKSQGTPDAKPLSQPMPGTAPKPGDFWEQWQAGEAQREAQRQQMMRNVDDGMARFQRGDQINRVQTPPDLLPRANPNVAPSIPGQPDKLSPKERWMAAEQRNQQREIEDNLEREKILNGIEVDGRNLAGLMYSEEGQRTVEEARRILTNIVGETSSKPTMFSIQEDYSNAEKDRLNDMNKHLLATWEETKRQKVEDLLQGGNLTNLEEAHYLRYMLGREPIATTNQNESSFRERAIAEFAQTRSNIGRGMLYKESDFKSPSDRTPVYLSASARFYNISQGQAQEAFGRGWDTAKIEASTPKATGST